MSGYNKGTSDSGHMSQLSAPKLIVTVSQMQKCLFLQTCENNRPLAKFIIVHGVGATKTKP